MRVSVSQSVSTRSSSRALSVVDPGTDDTYYSQLDDLDAVALVRHTRRKGWFPEDRATYLFAFYYFAFLYDLITFVVVMPAYQPRGPHIDHKEDLFGWHFMHLTVWGGYIQTAYFLCCLLDSFNRFDDWWREVFHPHRDRFFTMAFALGTLIAIGFWCVIFPDPKVQEHLKQHRYLFYSSFAEHGMTTLFIWTEMFIVYHEYSKSWKESTIVGVLVLVYVLWNFLCHEQNGVWPYNVQGSIPMAARYVVYPLSPFVAIGFYFLGKQIKRKYWDRELS